MNWSVKLRLAAVLLDKHWRAARKAWSQLSGCGTAVVKIALAFFSFVKRSAETYVSNVTNVQVQYAMDALGGQKPHAGKHVDAAYTISPI